MIDESASLDDLRREIDDLDARIHDLLMRRARVVDHVAAAKARAGLGGALLRPGREAQVIRRLLARHEGSLPPAAIVALWRELMTSFLRMQGPFEVAIWPGASEGAAAIAFWDLARAHFGASTPLALHDSAARALGALGPGRGAVAILPLPSGDEAGAWWPALLSDAPEAPRVVARLPFADGAEGNGRHPAAVVVAPFPAEPSGDDAAYLGLALAGEASRDRLAALLAQSGFEGRTIAAVDQQGISLHLAEVAGHVAADDPRLSDLLRVGEGLVARASVLGGFAVPVSLGAPRAQARGAGA